MDWQLFWTAFGAIGTTLGSLVTAVAVVVAVCQYKQPLAKRLRISFRSGIAILQNEDTSGLIHTISVSNIGVRPIILSNIYFNIGKNNLVLNNLEHQSLPQLQFPCTLEQEETAAMHFSCEVIGRELQRLISEKNISGNATIKILVTDTSGGEYFHNTKCRAKQLAKHSKIKHD